MTIEYYESLAQDAIDQANSIINDASSQTGQSKIDMLTLAKQTIDDSSNFLREMQNLLILLPTNEKAQAQRRIKLLSTRIKELEGRIETDKQRTKLFSNVSLDPIINSESQTESLSRTQNAIGSANQIGAGILSTLKSQHSVLKNAKMNADAIKSSVASTATRVRNMEKVAKQNKIIIFTIIGLLIVGIILLLYLKF